MTNPTETIDQTAESGRPAEVRGRRAGVLAVGVIVLLAAAWVLVSRDSSAGEQASFRVQGGGPDAEVYAEDAATLTRSDAGIATTVLLPTPAPGTYEYPARDVLPPGAPPHPAVEPGDSDRPEVFTLWMYVFNYPENCTDDFCDGDDLGLDASARGAVFQIDGRIGDADTLGFEGRVRLGELGDNGVNLENPAGAEVHLAVAPHGRLLTGSDAWRQFNGPIGSIPHWWAATFDLPEGE